MEVWNQSSLLLDWRVILYTFVNFQAATLEQISFFANSQGFPMFFFTGALQRDAGIKSEKQVIHQTDAEGVGARGRPEPDWLILMTGAEANPDAPSSSHHQSHLERVPSPT